MLVQVNEVDTDTRAKRSWIVELEKCPGRLRKMIKDTLASKDKKLDVPFGDSISFSENYSADEAWIRKVPCQVDVIITWYVV